MNSYCAIEDLNTRADVRKLGMLSNDNNQQAENTATVQALLDDQASELESHLAIWVTLPLIPQIAAVPQVLTKWVAIKTVEALYSRRSDRPKQLDRDITWANDWISKWDAGEVTIGVPRTVITVTPECFALPLSYRPVIVSSYLR